MKDSSFAAFYLRWAEHVAWEVPDIHLLACDWMEHGRRGRVGVLKGFRGLSKSTITGRYIPWRMRKNGNWRFMALSATEGDSKKLSADSKFVITQHPWCRNLKPKRGEWEVHKFSVEENADPRNPNVAAFGMTSNITGGRADEIIADDVEVPKTIRTPQLQEGIRQRLSETTHILVPGGKKLYIGTDHCLNSIYKEQIEGGADLLEIPLFLKEVTHQGKGKEKDFIFAFRIQREAELYVAVGLNKPRLLDASEYEVHGVRNFRGGFVRLKRAPAADERLTIYAGNQWEKRFDRAEIQFRMKECRTWGEWDSQYMLKAAQLTKVRLKPERLIPCASFPEIRTANGEITMFLGGVRLVGVSCYWDCSLGSKDSDTSALSVVFSDSAGGLYWLAAEAIKSEADADVQCLQVIEVIRRFRIPAITVETNGPGGFVPAILRKHLKMQNVACAVVNKHSVKNKNLRIIDALEPPLSGMFLYASREVIETVSPEMRNWNPAVENQPDDYLDSGAGAIAETAVRVGLNIAPVETQAQDWRPGGGVYDAAVDY